MGEGPFPCPRSTGEHERCTSVAEEMLEYLLSTVTQGDPSISAQGCCIFSAGTPTAQEQAVPPHTWK